MIRKIYVLQPEISLGAMFCKKTWPIVKFLDLKCGEHTTLAIRACRQKVIILQSNPKEIQTNTHSQTTGGHVNRKVANFAHEKTEGILYTSLKGDTMQCIMQNTNVLLCRRRISWKPEVSGKYWPELWRTAMKWLVLRVLCHLLWSIWESSFQGSTFFVCKLGKLCNNYDTNKHCLHYHDFHTWPSFL